MTTPPATILIVDDEPRNCKLLDAMLRPEGYRTRCAASGEEALEAIAQAAPDLILLDVMMPGMSGHDVARRLKANPFTSHIPIIMVTAQSDRAARLAGLDAGAEEFVAKPVERSELWLRVRNLLRLKSFGDFLRNYNAILEQQVQARTIDLQRFRSAMDATADGLFLISRDSLEFLEVNATACTLLGCSRDELFERGPAILGEASPVARSAMYEELIARGRQESVELQLTRKDGSALEIEMLYHTRQIGPDWIILAVARDITERKQAQQRLQQLAHFDALSGLPNRTLFYETLSRTLAHAAGQGGIVAVAFLDIDHFKSVNDTLGHACGDELLRQVSQRLVECVRQRDTVGRLGGDEFALILQLGDKTQAATLVASKVGAVLRQPFLLLGHEVSVSASIGITLYPDDATDPRTLIKYADTAMYRAKQAGRDTFRFFTAQMNADVIAQRELDVALRAAIDQEQFVLHYQPKVDLDTGAVIGLEALLRWRRPGQGLVSPQEFIPTLEDTGLIVPVGSWVIHEACRQMRRWLDCGVGRMPVAVNVSSRQFVEGDLEDDLVRALEANDLPPDMLEIELTETSLMANTDRAIAILTSLKQRGVKISVDDFGTGYSSLAYLRRFPVDKLKIDMSFIRHITTSADDAMMVLTIIRMAHSLRLDVVAEGVEDPGQLAYLHRHRCDQIQGYLYSKPLPVDQVTELILKKIPLHTEKFDRTLRTLHTPTPTLLIVDDEPQILAALKRLLRPMGYLILTAPSGEAALQRMAEHHVDVIISDQRMPGMTGIAFLCMVKERYPEAIRMILSGYADLQSVTDAVNQGAVYKFMNKPWDDEQLILNLEEAFDHKRLTDLNSRLGKERDAARSELALVRQQLQARLPPQAVPLSSAAIQP